MVRIKFCLCVMLSFVYLLEIKAQLKIVYATKEGFPVEMNLQYKCPKEFTECFDLRTTLILNDSRAGYFGALIYQIESKQKDLVIVFRAMRTISKEDSISLYKAVLLKPMLYPNPNPPLRNTQYLQNIILHADTSYFKPIKFSKKYSSRQFNADHSGMYQVFLTKIYLDKYDKCRMVYMQKKDIGVVEILYFYNNSSSKKIDRWIKQTSGMIRFSN